MCMRMRRQHTTTTSTCLKADGTGGVPCRWQATAAQVMIYQQHTFMIRSVCSNVHDGRRTHFTSQHRDTLRVQPLHAGWGDTDLSSWSQGPKTVQHSPGMDATATLG
jgi:hypothetical protein